MRLGVLIVVICLLLGLPSLVIVVRYLRWMQRSRARAGLGLSSRDCEPLD